MCRLGSRLFFEFTAAALGDAVAWEGLADSVAVEVRRHGAPAVPVSPQAGPPAPAKTAAHDPAIESAPPHAVMRSPAALAAPPPLPRDIAAPRVAGSTAVRIDNSNNSNNIITNITTNNNNAKASNFGNTAIVLL